MEPTSTPRYHTNSTAQDHEHEESLPRGKMPSAVRNCFIVKKQEECSNLLIADCLRLRNLTHQTCTLCEQPRPSQQMDCLSTCNHLFCSTCLNTYCVYKINLMEIVSCPEEGCNKEISTESRVYLSLSQEIKDRFKRNMLWRQTINNSNLKLCPTADCEGVINLSKGRMHCHKCRVVFCRQCELPRHQGPCDVNFQHKFKNWKRCPKCQTFIERVQGCNHMTCRCSHDFCYICLADWTDEHYECQSQPHMQVYQIFGGWQRWKQIVFGTFLTIFFPVVLILLVLFYVKGIFVSFAGGFLVGPMVIYSKIQQFQNIVGAFLCPVLMVVGAVSAMVGWLGFGVYLMFRFLVQYWFVVALALCGPRHDEQSQFGSSIYSDSLNQ